MLELNSLSEDAGGSLPVVHLQPATHDEALAMAEAEVPTAGLPDVDDEVQGPLSFREHLWDRFELLWARRVAPSRKMLEGFVACMRERAQLERQYARGLMQSVAKLQQTTSEGVVHSGVV
ncbi:hypothetical protein AK812_SmicGene41659 [Symbiodinium microadriaticum]|uniref:FCH domain-containing protein n=1 Tax=Symbiodinium microadriaticum TaxID=2951 RepID=A0A1Q9C5J3_SYMMI|nr:hypothetical protein AK812_SmicGene41659 [Symbiodinium microadriaticum]